MICLSNTAPVQNGAPGPVELQRGFGDVAVNCLHSFVNIQAWWGWFVGVSLQRCLSWDSWRRRLSMGSAGDDVQKRRGSLWYVAWFFNSQFWWGSLLSAPPFYLCRVSWSSDHADTSMTYCMSTIRILLKRYLLPTSWHSQALRYSYITNIWIIYSMNDLIYNSPLLKDDSNSISLWPRGTFG